MVVVVKLKIVVSQEEPFQQGDGSVKSGEEEEEVPLNLPPAIEDMEVEEPTFGDAVPIGLWKKKT